MRNRAFALIGFLAAAGLAHAQDAVNADDVQAGHKVAVAICANCHVAAPDQAGEPIMRPPAPAFASIAQRKSLTAEHLRNYLTTTHRGLDNLNGMPNPQLLDFQIRQVSAYLLSLRNVP